MEEDIVRISELPGANPLAGPELVPLVQDGVTKTRSAVDIVLDGGLQEHLDASDPHSQYAFRVKNNLEATTNPTVNDDINEGYTPTSRWVNTATEEFFICVTNTAGNANWQTLTLTLDELGSAALADTGAGNGLDADLLDAEQGSYYLDFPNFTNLPDPVLTLTGDVSGSATFTNLGDATLSVAVDDDSHNHIISNVDGLQDALDDKVDKVAGKGLSTEDYTTAEKNKLSGIESGATADQDKADIEGLGISYNSLSERASGLGAFSVTSNVESGRGSGGVALTINDGQGNANVTFNHAAGVAEQDGNVGRIIVNTDDTVGASMSFDVTSNDTAGPVTSVTQMTLTEGNLDVTGFSINGINSNAFTNADESKLDGIESGATADQTAGEIKSAYESNANTNAFTDADESKLDGIESGAEVNTVDSVNGQTGVVTVNEDNFYLTNLNFNTVDGILTATVNGAANQTVDLDGRYLLTTGKAADSDKLDNINSSQFLRSDESDTFSGKLTGNSLTVGGSDIQTSGLPFQVNGGQRTGDIYLHEGGLNPTGESAVLSNDAGTLSWSGFEVWHSGNDGPSSGLNADLLDGVESGGFLRSNQNDTALNQITFSQPILLGNLEKTNLSFDGELSYDSSQGLIVQRSAVTTTVLDGVNVQAGANVSITNLGAGGSANEKFVISSTDTNYYTSNLNFNTSDGILTATVNGATNQSVDLDGRYLLQGAKAADSEKLDNLDSTQFVRSDTDDTLNGKYLITANTVSPNYNNGQLELRATDSSDVSLGFHRSGDSATQLRHENNGLILSGSSRTSAADFQVLGDIIADGTFNGNGSGLTNVDAETLDNLNSTDFARLSARSDGYIWIRRNSGPGGAPLYATQQATGEIARFLQGGGDGSLVSSVENDGTFETSANVVTKGGYVEHANSGQTEGCRVQYNETSKSLDYNFF